MLASRSAELRAKRDAEAAADQQLRLQRQLAKAQAEAQDLAATLAAMKVRPAVPALKQRHRLLHLPIS